MDWDQKEAELRADGWSDGEVRDYKRGYESTAETFERATMPASSAPRLSSFTDVQVPRVLARGDRGLWARTTIAGQLRSVASPDEPDEGAREMQAARKFADDWEFTYGRRPSMAEARLAVGRRSDGAVLGDTAEEIGQVFRAAGLPFSILSEVRPLPSPDAVTRQPVRRG